MEIFCYMILQATSKHTLTLMKNIQLDKRVFYKINNIVTDNIDPDS